MAVKVREVVLKVVTAEEDVMLTSADDVRKAVAEADPAFIGVEVVASTLRAATPEEVLLLGDDASIFTEDDLPPAGGDTDDLEIRPFFDSDAGFPDPDVEED